MHSKDEPKFQKKKDGKKQNKNNIRKLHMYSLS